MKTISSFAIAILTVASLTSSCSGRAKADTEAVAATVENDLETVNARNAVNEWEGGPITPDPALPIVIDFNADWCPPCRMFKPVFDKAAEANRSHALFVSVNVDSYPDVARQFNVTSIPQTSILMPDGKVVTATGYMDDDAFASFLSDALPK